MFPVGNGTPGNHLFRRDHSGGRRYPACDPPAFVTLLSPRVTPFQSRNANRRSVAESGAEWRTAALDGARTILDALTRVMTSRDSATAAHARRVQRYASALAHEMCAADDLLIDAVQTAALLHDIG